MIRALIFDMDGVIVDSEEHWAKEEYELLKTYVPQWNKEHHKQIMGMSLHDLYAHIHTEHKASVEKEEFLRAYEQIARELYGKKADLYPGLLNLVEEADVKHMLLAVCSSAPLSWIQIVIERFKLGEYFDALISADMLNGGNGKPAPDIYLLAAQMLRVKPDECVVIEDSQKGIMAAKAAGMYCIAFRNGSNKSQSLKQADRTVKRLDEINLKAFTT